MKKILILFASLFIIGVIGNAQVEKKEPPPPPPKPKDEKIKSTQPEIIYDEKINKTKPVEPPVITIKGKKADEFYERNPTVSVISRQGSVITIKNKDGSIEKYDTGKKVEDKSFTEKYGVCPIPPPPPPPKVVKSKT
jgi:hypothetical protein